MAGDGEEVTKPNASTGTNKEIRQMKEQITHMASVLTAFTSAKEPQQIARQLNPTAGISPQPAQGQSVTPTTTSASNGSGSSKQEGRPDQETARSDVKSSVLKERKSQDIVAELFQKDT
jgi:hypothetical protein